LVIDRLLNACDSCIIEHWDESQLQEQQSNHSSGKRWLFLFSL
jgi:predicted SnoaL-like aldol condensation-catalyzing enzyme